MQFINGVQKLPELRRLLWPGLFAQADLPKVFGLGQAAQGGVMFQFGFFFVGQSDFHPYFFIVSTQIDSSVLLDFRRGRGYSGVSLGNGFCPLGGEIRCSLSLWTLSLWTGGYSMPMGRESGLGWG